MIRALLPAALLLAAPAAAEIAPGTLDCRSERMCATPGRCSDATATTPMLTLTLHADGAEMRQGETTIAFRRVEGFGTAQTYLAAPWAGVVLFTLEPDLSFAIAAHEKVVSGLSATAGLGTCTRRSG